MPKEKFSAPAEVYDIETLSAQTKMRMLLEIFDLNPDKEGNKRRKAVFEDLMRQYYEASVLARARGAAETEIKGSETHKAELHNKIMDIIQRISHSMGLTKDQHALADYLGRNRKQVEEMIRSYYSSSDYSPNDPTEHTVLKQALRGDGWFTAPPGKEDD